MTIKKGEASFDYLHSDEVFKSRFKKLLPSIEDAFPIPGIFGAWSLAGQKLTFSQYLTPQGLAVSEKYIFVSAYDNKKTVNSVIYVIDRIEHKFIKTLVLNGRPHLGGIYYDEKNQELWATGNWAKDEDIIIFTLNQIKRYDIKKEKPLIPKYTFKLGSIARSSALTIFENKLYVAVFNQFQLGSVQVFNIKHQKDRITLDSLSKKLRTTFYSDTYFDSIVQTQGVALNKKYLYLTASFGPRKSRLVRYLQNTNIFTQGEFVYLPPYLEQVVLEDEKIFAIFEGSALAYRKRTTKTVDRIAVFNAKELFKKAKKYRKLKETALLTQEL